MDWNYWIYVWIFSFISVSSVGGGTVIWEDRVRFLREPKEKLIATSGSDVEIPCLAVDGTGNPSGKRLSVRWLRNGLLAKDLTPQANGSLIVRNVQIEQEGVYQCAVLSTRYGVVLSQRANLTISKITNFTDEPQDVDTTIGSAVRFQCNVAADSVPSVTIEWFHNHLSLVEGGQRIRTLPSGILQIANVKKTDEGSYYCIASNAVGNITSRTASLTTSESLAATPGQPLEIRVLKAPSNVSVNTGGRAIFECLFEGADNVVWKKIGSPPLSSRAYRVGTNLLIDKLSPLDEGRYVCVGSTNAGKSLTLFADLSVDIAPEIRKFPEEKLSRRGESWRFYCDVASKPVPTIVWYKDGEPLRSHGRIKIFPNEEQLPNKLEKPSGEINYGRDLLISSVQADDVGFYQCFASNYLGTTSAAAALSYLDVDLEGPSNLSAAILSNQRDIQLSWNSPEHLDDQHHLTVYIVHFHESESGSENTVAVQQDACHRNVCRTVCCSNVDLVPYTNYTFWVDALVVYQGEPLFTRTTDLVVVTSGDAVSLSVAPAAIQELPDATRLRLSWEKPLNGDLRGQLLEYRIEIREAVQDVDERRPLIIVSPTSNDFVIDDLVDGSIVYCRVIPATHAGFPDLLPDKAYPWLRHKVRAIGRSSSVSAAPVIDVQPLNSSSVLVRWSLSSHSNVKKWLISTYSLSDGLVTARSELDGNTSSTVLVGLGSEKWYQVSVVAVLSDGQEGLLSSRLVRTLAAATPRTASVLPASDPIIPFPTPKCQIVEQSKLKIYWNTPPMNIVKFALRYSLLPGDDESLNVSAYVKQRETSMNSIIFSDLAPGRNYLFAVRAENADGYKSAFSDDISCFIPLIKPLPPTNIEVSVTSTSSLLVSWTRSSDVLFYHIHYTNNFSDAGSWKELAVNGMNNSAHVGISNSSGAYFISVSAENEAGRGAESAVKIVHVSDFISGDSTANPPSIVIFRTSYKEGIIIGVCIAVVCAAACAAIIFMCSKRDRRFCVGWLTTRQRSTSAKSSNCYAPNGHCGNEKRIELAEIQTLLPRLIENVDSDTKGCAGSSYAKGYPISRNTFALSPLSNGCVRNDGTGFWEPSQPHNELLTVAIQPSRIEPEQHGEQSSDLSQSPAAGSSLGSWVHTGYMGDVIGGILCQKRHHSSVSLPNLFDSGIGFDDLSVSYPHNGRCHPFPVSSGSPRRQATRLANKGPPADSVTLPGCRLTVDLTAPCDNAKCHQTNVPSKRLRDLFSFRQPQESRHCQAAVELGPVGNALSSSRATSNCTC